MCSAISAPGVISPLTRWDLMSLWVRFMALPKVKPRGLAFRGRCALSENPKVHRAIVSEDLDFRGRSRQCRRAVGRVDTRRDNFRRSALGWFRPRILEQRDPASGGDGAVRQLRQCVQLPVPHTLLSLVQYTQRYPGGPPERLL